MSEQINDYLGQIETGKLQEYKNLGMVPLVSAYKDTLDYLLLDEALEQGVIEVTELDEGGSVTELRVVNRSGKMVLIFDGEELVGAKQNRIVNTTILLAPKSKTIIPVSCVEQGRWSSRSESFASEKRMSPSYMRKNKSEQVLHSVRETGRFRASQGEIWDEISRRQARRGVSSATSEMAELYRRDRLQLDEYINRFHPVDNQIGALFIINGKVTGLDSFGKPEVFSKVFSKLLESYAVDALDWYNHEKKVSTNAKDAERFVKESKVATVEQGPSVGLGVDCRLTSETQIGSGLIFEKRVLHLSVFDNPQSTAQRTRKSRMSRMSQRRRYRSE